MSIDMDPQGFEHPTSVDQVRALVRQAREEGRTLRVHGDGHSVAHAIWTDPLGSIENKVKPKPPAAGPNINIVLDSFGDGGVPGWRVVPDKPGVIEVDGGMTLGSGPPGPGRKGLLEQLNDHGLMLRSTGGIAHQTVAGFIGTASAGGSLTTSVSDLVCGITFIDGEGTEVTIDEGDDDFHGVVPHLGLLGVVTRVRLRSCPAFTVKGKQVSSTPADAGLDLSGEGVGTPLADFLKERAREYARIEWWPQRGIERVRIWEGRPDERTPPNFRAKPFHLFKPFEQPAAAVVLTVLGNLDDHGRMFRELMKLVHGSGALVVARVVLALRRIGTPGGDDIASLVLNVRARRTLQASEVQSLLERSATWLRDVFPWLLDLFAKPGEVKNFHDRAWRLLPMDDEVDDFYLPIEFTEIWVPLKKATDAMKALDTYFGPPDNTDAAFTRTGTFQIELYATKKSKFWLDPAYSNDDDDWSEGALRINPYWYGRNDGDPAHTFFPRFWDALREAGIPYRLHWGKFLPPVQENPWWPAWIQDQYRHWNDFMTLRKKHDPDNIFVNDYWSKHLGLSR